MAVNPLPITAFTALTDIAEEEQVKYVYIHTFIHVRTYHEPMDQSVCLYAWALGVLNVFLDTILNEW